MTRAIAGVFLCLLSLAACSDSAVETPNNAWELTDDAGQRVDAADQTCARDSDCGDGNHCFHPTTCGSTPYCKPGYSGCSAAAPYIVCGCDGTISSAAAGCPGPSAWEAGALAWDDAFGAPCDPAAVSPFEFDVEVVISDEENLLDGGNLFARLSDGSEPREVDDSRVARFEFTGDAWDTFAVDLLVDADGDGRCTPGVDADFYTAMDEQTIDLVTFELVRNVSPRPVTSPCERWP